jgi:hypothetical protein
VWRVKWPDNIRQRYKTEILTNSALEMAAIIIMMLVLEQLMPLKRQHCQLFSDNTPSVSWTTKLVANSGSQATTNPGHAQPNHRSGATSNGPLARG